MRWTSRSGTPATASDPGTGYACTFACSDYPLYIWHPGTGENPWHATRGQRNEQTLITGGSAPSHLSITVLGNA